MMAPRPLLAACGAAVLLILSYPRELAAVTAASEPVRIAVIVSAGSTLREVSSALLRRIFLGELTAHGGTRFIPLNYPPGAPLRIAFDREALGLDPEASGRYWIDRRIRGQGLPPRAIPSPALLREIVAKLPGAIGYIPADQVNASVRALEVDGLDYKDPDYPLAND